MATRQAINVGFPNPNFVAETGIRQAILPGVFLVDTVVNTVNLSGRITTAVAARIATARQARLSTRATTAAKARATAAPEAHISAKATTASTDRAAPTATLPITGRAATAASAKGSATKQNRLAGRIETASEARATPPLLAVTLAGRLTTESASSLDLPIAAATLRGRISTAAGGSAPLTPRALRVAGLQRETLLSTDAAHTDLRVGGTARESLVADAQPSVLVGGSLRETLLSTDDTTTSLSVAATARETLISVDDASADNAMLVGASVRETLLSTDGAHTELRVAGLVRETLLFSREGMLSGRITTRSQARGAVLRSAPLTGRIGTASRAVGEPSRDINLFGRIKTAANAKMVPAPGLERPNRNGVGDPLWVAIDIDVWDEDAAEIFTLRLSNKGALTVSVNGAIEQYFPRLQVPFTLGVAIASDSSLSVTGITSFYGNPMRAEPNGGTFQFEIDPAFWHLLDARYHWIGRDFQVYQHSSFLASEDRANFEPVYHGFITAVAHDGATVSITTTDKTLAFNEPLVADFFDDTAPADLQFKPKPAVWGTARNVTPVLLDQQNLLYWVSKRVELQNASLPQLADILELTVGGVPWRRNDMGPPGQGEWTPDLFNGTVQLGAVTLGAEVRCTARSSDYAIMTTAGLVNAIVGGSGAATLPAVLPVFTDPAYKAQLDLDAPQLLGYFASPSSPRNRADALDEIMLGVGGWWSCGPTGLVQMGILAPPDTPLPDAWVFDESNLQEFALTEIVPPACQIRVEHSRNWDPLSSVLGGVTDDAKRQLSEPGIYITFKDDAIRTAEPRAPADIIVRSLFNSEADAQTVLARLVACWMVTRRVYTIASWVAQDRVGLMMDSVPLQYEMVDVNVRAFSVVRSLGGGAQQFVLWG